MLSVSSTAPADWDNCQNSVTVTTIMNKPVPIIQCTRWC